MKRSNSTRGFTLIELLVVVAIIALLIAILLPALSKSRQTAKEVTCGVDIRTLIQVTVIYATDYKSHLPRLQHNPATNHINPHVYQSYPYWRDLLIDTYGVQRSMLYSPNNEIWNDDGLFYFGWDGVDPDTATNMVMGRFYFGTEGLVDVNVQGSKMGLLSGIVDPTMPTTGTVFATRTTDTPFTDIIWTDLNRKYAGVFVSGGNRWGSNHLYDTKKNFPEGTHNGHLDGHVEWVPANEIRLRAQWPAPGSADLYW